MSVEQGAQTSLHISSIPYKELVVSGYYSNCKVATKNKSIKTLGNFEEFMKRSTKMCEDAAQIKFKHLVW